MFFKKQVFKMGFLGIGMCLLSGCNIAEDIQNIGKPPPFTPTPDPFKNVPASYAYAGKPQGNRAPQSLWSQGNRSFFDDQRARHVGDILTVLVEIKGEKAQLESNSERRREKANESLIINSLLGLKAKGIINPAADAGTKALDIQANPEFSGKGKIDRKEDIIVKISVIVSEVLPNGNMMISGRQEIRVNFEIREIFISGIVRPQDISANNTITWDKIAEARIGYGGRGQISQFQQPAYGTQLMDILLPF